MVLHGRVPYMVFVALICVYSVRDSTVIRPSMQGVRVKSPTVVFLGQHSGYVLQCTITVTFPGRGLVLFSSYSCLCDLETDWM
jgi:hypothetical protein